MKQYALMDTRVKNHVCIATDLEVDVQIDDVHDEVQLVEVHHELE